MYPNILMSTSAPIHISVAFLMTTKKKLHIQLCFVMKCFNDSELWERGNIIYFAWIFVHFNFYVEIINMLNVKCGNFPFNCIIFWCIFWIRDRVNYGRRKRWWEMQKQGSLFIHYLFINHTIFNRRYIMYLWYMYSKKYAFPFMHLIEFWKPTIDFKLR